ALLARWQDEFKQFDLGLWIFLAIGAVAVTMGIGPVVELYQRYSPALLFAMFGLTTVIPLLAGREPFTVWYGVRQLPRWQHGTPASADISRVLAAFGALVFFTAALLCAIRPTDPLFTAVLPNLLVLLIGLPAARWLPPLWMKLFPSEAPDAAE